MWSAILPTIAEASSENGLLTVGLPARSAVIASVADILNWLETRTLANFVGLDSVANLDNHTCSFVARTLGSQVGHLGEVPIVQHEVDIAEAEARRVEFDQDIVGSYGQAHG